MASNSPETDQIALITERVFKKNEELKDKVDELLFRMYIVIKKLHEKIKISRLEREEQALSLKRRYEHPSQLQPTEKVKTSQINDDIKNTKLQKKSREPSKRICVRRMELRMLDDAEIVRYINNRINAPHKVLILSPTESLLIKVLDDPSEHLLLMEGNDWVLFPVTDSMGFNEGNHWSLLVYQRHLGDFFHFDSSKGFNLKHARALARNITTNRRPKVKEIPCRQQIQGVECGAHMLHNMSVVCRLLQSNRQLNFQNFLHFKKEFSIIDIYRDINNNNKDE